jgi:hypothetical protein
MYFQIYQDNKQVDHHIFMNQNKKTYSKCWTWNFPMEKQKVWTFTQTFTYNDKIKFDLPWKRKIPVRYYLQIIK